MKKMYWIILAVVILLAFVVMIFKGSEDDWIKDERGVWVKHGNPADTPSYVLEQQSAISCALNLYEDFSVLTVEISSQCLGVCRGYAVDIVHVPRTSEDDLSENQCQAYRNGEAGHFIELDKEGNIVRIV